jgi:predicted DNA-binding protein
MAEKKKTSVNLSAEARQILARLSKALGVSQSACMELAIREMARKYASR